MAFIISLVSAALLVSSVFYTRLFSILYWHTSAFAVLTVALLGLSVAGLTIFFKPGLFPKEYTKRYICVLLPTYALVLLCSYIGVLEVSKPTWVIPKFFSGFSGQFLPPALVAFTAFFTGGLIVSLILFRYHRDVSRLYFFDMLGASLGALTAVWLIYVFNGQNIILFLGILITLTAMVYAYKWREKYAGYFAASVLLLLAAYTVIPSLNNQLMIQYAKGQKERAAELEQWAPAARVKVLDGKFQLDSGVITPILPFNGKLKTVSYLKHNILQLGYHLGPYERVVIIGPGGGSDVLGALVSGNKDITAVEINSGIVRFMKNELTERNGGLYNRPEINVVIDEGRSYLASLSHKVDFIQATFIDTYAAAISGAHTLSENYLYTTDAIHDYLDRLNDDGIVSISRWGGSLHGYVEIQRVVAIAERALRQRGIQDPQKHIIVAQGARYERRGPRVGYQGHGATSHMATALISKSPFTDKQLKTIHNVIRDNQFIPLWVPGIEKKGRVMEGIFNSGGSDAFYQSRYLQTGMDISPVTDDKPFFFSMLRPNDFYWSKKFYSKNNRVFLGKAAPVYSLYRIFYALLFLAAAFIAVPLFFKRADVKPLASSKYFILYFTCLGLGFMGVELGLMQRFSLFLGHPTYALVIVLASLLFFSALGSLYSGRVNAKKHLYLTKISVLLVLLLALYAGLPVLLKELISFPLLAKCTIAILLIAPLGFLMGMLYPLGIKILTRHNMERLIPWMWGLNTGFSVVATVLSLYLSMSYGFSFAWYAFTVCYALAALSVWRLHHQQKNIASV